MAVAPVGRPVSPLGCGRLTERAVLGFGAVVGNELPNLAREGLGEAIRGAWRGIERIRGTWQLPDSFLRHGGLPDMTRGPRPEPIRRARVG
jgi:hypothetical protein